MAAIVNKVYSHTIFVMFMLITHVGTRLICAEKSYLTKQVLKVIDFNYSVIGLALDTMEGMGGVITDISCRVQ